MEERWEVKEAIGVCERGNDGGMEEMRKDQGKGRHEGEEWKRERMEKGKERREGKETARGGGREKDGRIKR